MNEDDTFRRLKRLSYDEVMEKITSSGGGIIHDNWPQVWAGILVESSWTAQEWLDALNNQHHKSCGETGETDEEKLERMERLLQEYRESKKL